MRTNASLETEQAKSFITPYVTLHYSYAIWKASTAYALTDYVEPIINTGYGYECTTAGTSGTTEPTWPTTVGNTVADGTVIWTCRATVWADISSRILEIDHQQEVYGSIAAITLRNEDGGIDSLDVKNRKLRIGWGAVTEAGNEVSYPPYLWGQGQELISAPGVAEFVIYGIGAWNKLARWIADADYDFNKDTPARQNMTIKEILNWVCEVAGTDLGTSITEDSKVDAWKPVFTIRGGETGAEAVKYLLSTFTGCVLVPRDDTLCLKYPETGDAVDYDYYSAQAHYFRRALSQSQNFKPMKVKITSALGYKSGETTGTTANKLVDSDATFSTWGVAVGWIVHNMTDDTYTTVSAVDSETQLSLDDDIMTTSEFYAVYSSQAQYEGSYAHSNWDSSKGTEEVDVSALGIVSSNGDCDDIAQTMVERAESQAEAGSIVVPIMNCLQEIYDKVEMHDTRNGIGNTTGRVGGLFAHYKTGAGKYSLEVRLGGVQRTLATNIQQLVDDMFMAGPISGKLIKQYTISPDSLRRAMQAYEIDLEIEAKDDDEIFWHGSAGVGTDGEIAFADGTTQAITEKVQASALTLTATHFLYFDLADPDPGTLKSSTNKANAVGEHKGLVALAVIASDANQKALILPFKGLEPTLNATVLCANIILAEHIKAGEITLAATSAQGKVTGTIDDLGEEGEGSTYFRILRTDINAGHIALSSVTQEANYRTSSDTEKGVWNAKNQTFIQASAPTAVLAGDLWFDSDDNNKAYRWDGDSWNIVRDGEITQLRTDIGDGTLTLSSLTTISGAWYVESGVAIDATKGIGLYGNIEGGQISLKTYPTFADYEADTNVQCYVGTDGKLYAGAGAVVLDASGIVIKGQVCAFKDTNNVERGFVHGHTAGNLYLVANQGLYHYNATGDEIISLPGQSYHFRPWTDDHGNLGGAANWRWHEVHAFAIVDHSPHFPILNPGGYLESLEKIQIRPSDMKVVVSSLPSFVQRQPGDGVELGDFCALAIGAIYELKERVEALEARYGEL